MNTFWEVFWAACTGIGFVTLIAFVVILAIIAFDTPGDEWDGQNHPLDDGSWTAADEEWAHEAARFKRGDDQ